MISHVDLLAALVIVPNSLTNFWLVKINDKITFSVLESGLEKFLANLYGYNVGDWFFPIELGNYLS